MLLEPAWALCERRLFTTPSTHDLFNPYRDAHPELDGKSAATIRRENLHRYLRCYTERPPVILLAEAPGPWGCRFSGVPITSEAQLADPGFPLDGQPTSTAEAPHSEYSASIYWRVMQPFFPHFFTWNSVPLHPHRPGEPLTIRPPRRREIKASAGLLAELLDVLRPERVLAVGRKAEFALHHIGWEATYVRHPSQGGARLFEEGVTAVFREMDLAR